MSEVARLTTPSGWNHRSRSWRAAASKRHGAAALILVGASPSTSRRVVVEVLPEARDARPIAVYLHGLCCGPEAGCRYFRRVVGDRAWLLCPSAPRACGGGASWQGPLRDRVGAVERVVAAAARRSPGGVDRATPGVLIGFSQGAYEAWRQVRAAPGRWRGAAFIGAFLHLRRAQLAAAGVRRLVLAAGRRDVTRATLAANAESLRSEGFPVRFVDLGAVGHTYAPGRGGSGWREALAWLSERE